MPLYPGSTDTLTLTVDPFDNTTAITVTVTAPPGGTDLNPTVVTADGGHTWTGTAVYATAGRWVAHWTVTNTGAGKAEEEIWVSAPATAAAAVVWRPELWHVADYVPGRTLVGAVDGYGTALNTFDNTTHPPAASVQRLVTAGCAWVLAKTGPVDASLTDMARAVAAIWVGAAVLRGFPDNTKDTTDADRLLQQAETMRDDLHFANVAITGTDIEDPEATLLPVFSFPAPVAWGDVDFG